MAGSKCPVSSAEVGPSEERMSDSETGARASLLVKESNSEALAWLSKRSLASISVSSVLSVVEIF